MLDDGFSRLRDAVIELTIRDYVMTIPGGSAERKILSDVRSQHFRKLLEFDIDPEALIKVMNRRRKEFIEKQKRN